MKRFLLFTSLSLVALFVLGTSLVLATTSQITAVPDKIPTNTATELQIARLTPEADTIVSLKVTDPSGTVWTHGPSAGQTIPLLPSTYNVDFGGASTGWTSNDGDAAQTDESGEYTAQIIYIDGSRGDARFSANAFFTVPEFALPLTIPTALGFAGLTLIRRRLKKA